MYRVFEYTKDSRGNFVTKSKDAPHRWFKISRPRSSNLSKSKIKLCLETYEHRVREYITGLISLNFKSCYVGDIKDETIIVWYRDDRCQIIILTGTKEQKINTRIKEAELFLQKMISDRCD